MRNTWILVADGGRARLFACEPPGRTLSEVACFANPDGRLPGRELVTERPPRVDESVGGARHAIEPHTTLREKSTERFARTLSAALERGRLDRLYERLVLVAPARFLGALHGCIGKPLLGRVVGEVRRNFTALPTPEILERLPRRLLH
ncbi:host attachment protein [Frateuria defendens]|uniref:host attachment protein n=1 Tax=Frateuria defendens TaxID=2219559 RepID=UPI00066FC2D7|nr:host attachment protein [Frateuria defendens]